VTGPVKVNPTGSKTKYAEEPLPGARRETVTSAGRLLEAPGNRRPREMAAPMTANAVVGTELGLQLAAVLDGGGNFKGSRLRSFVNDGGHRRARRTRRRQRRMQPRRHGDTEARSSPDCYHEGTKSRW